jgi:prevent-host-death family protein
MFYSAVMQRIPVRELRNQASRVVRRARAGERLIITVDGIAAAEIGPVSVAARAPRGRHAFLGSRHVGAVSLP